jgi:glycosyltransferase involved in cell wall biosynthesis
MKIWLAPNSYYPVTGGVQTVVRGLAHALAERGHDVLIVTTRPLQGGGDGAAAPRFATHRFSFSIARNDARSWLIFLLRLFPSLLKLARLYRKQRPDLVNLHYLDEQAFYLMLLRELYRFPLVLSLHGSDLLRNPAQSALLRFTLRRLLKKADLVVTPSRYLMDAARSMYPRHPWRGAVIHNGMDFSRLDATPCASEEESPYIVAVGRLDHVKGFDVLIRALRLVLEGGLSRRLLLVGDGPERENLQGLARSEGVQQMVRFLGALEPGEVYSRIRGSSFLVLPSRSESFGIVLLEAMAQGKTVVACKVGGIPEIVRDGVNGLLVESEDPVQLARAITLLIRDEHKRRALESEALRDVRERFDNARLHAEYLESYARVLEHHPLRP